MELEPIGKSCVGCGYCCTHICSAGARVYSAGVTLCPALEWDKNRNRHFCRLMQLPGDIGARYREELYAGAGCCSAMNTWRDDIQDRTKPEEKVVKLDRYFQIFLNHLGKEFISSDSIYLALSGVIRDISKEVGEEKAKEIGKLIMHYFKNARSSFNETFMG